MTELDQFRAALHDHEVKMLDVVSRLEQQLAAALGPRHTDQILTRPEARAHVKRPSEAAFCDWCRRWRVRPCARGRYSRLALDQALQLEARAGRRGSPTKKAA